MAAVEADAVIVDLEARLDKYRANMLEAIDLQQRYQKGWTSPANDTASSSSANQRSSNAKKAASDVASAEEQATQRVQRTRKARVDAAVSEAAATKKAAADAAAAEEAAQARITAAVEKGISQRAAASRRGSGSQLGTTAEAGARAAASRQTAVMAGTVVPGSAAAEEVAAETEVNALLADQARLQAALTYANKEDAAVIRDKLAELRLINQLQRAGIEDGEIALELDKRALAIETERASVATRQLAAARAQTVSPQTGGRNVARFAEGAGLGRSFGSTATVAGIATAAGVGIGAEAVASATEYAKALSEVAHQAGISAESLQVYQHAAVDAGAKSTDLDTGLIHLSDSLGRARTGAQQQSKVFAALGVDIKNTTSAGDLLPTLIDRISSISDQSKRAAVEVALFGESGAKLDGLLSGGTAKVNELAQALQDTGSILSSADIAKLDDVSKKLAAVKAQLQVDLAEVVAGNADSIESLAKAFADLANDIFGAIHALDEYGKNDTLGKFLANPAGAGGQVRQYLNDKTSAALTAVGIPGFAPGAASSGRRSTALSDLSNSASDFLKVQPGKVDQAALDRINAPKGPKGKSTEQLQKEAAERQIALINEQAKEQETRLGLLADLTADTRDQDAIQRQVVEIQRKAANDVLDQQGPKGTKRYTDAQVARLQSLNDENADLKDRRINQSEAARYIQEQLASAKTSADIQTALLDNQEAIADTSAERRKIETRLLQIAQQQEQAGLQAIIDDKTQTPQAKANAQTRLNALPSIYAGRQAGLDRQTESPGQSYARSLKSTSDTVQDSEVTVLKSFNTELDKSITSALKLHGIFGQIVGDLVDMAIKQALIRPLANSLFGGSSTSSTNPNAATGGLFGGLLKGIGSLFGGGGSSSGGGGLNIGGNFGSSLLGGAVSAIDPAFLGLPGLAGGGSFQVGGNGGIDRNLLSINGRPVVRVNNGETIAVVPPNAAASNQRVYSPNSPVTLHQTINVDGRNSVTPADFASQIIAVSADHANRAAAQAQAGAVAAAPARVQRVQTLGN